MAVAKLVGFYKEIHAFTQPPGIEFPSIGECEDVSTVSIDQRLLAYLDSGRRHSFIGGRLFLRDPGDRSKIKNSGFLITDGVWLWPSELSYYLRSFNLKLPVEFMDHVIANEWRIPADIDPSGIKFSGAVKA